MSKSKKEIFITLLCMLVFINVPLIIITILLLATLNIPAWGIVLITIPVVVILSTALHSVYVVERDIVNLNKRIGEIHKRIEKSDSE